MKLSEDEQKKRQASIDQAKATSECHICHQLGHWSRECPQRPKSQGRGKQARTYKDHAFAATAVDDEGDVAMSSISSHSYHGDDRMNIDCGCTRSVIGQETLQRQRTKAARALYSADFMKTMTKTTFRFGNNNRLGSDHRGSCCNLGFQNRDHLYGSCPWRRPWIVWSVRASRIQRYH